ncbi:hypothetical protein C1H46_015569 [Malus baccata]|uniref:Uncharacterized protein n=1 Tax=Malus baccata TaxID=106549 RepID=A0A540MJG4_MALBA|nr:hypothetical protein C1H46_015569 [Malus baccata]
MVERDKVKRDTCVILMTRALIRNPKPQFETLTLIRNLKHKENHWREPEVGMKP